MKNEQELIKFYNPKTNMMLVIKNLMPAYNRILLTIVQCDKDKKALKNVDFFFEPIDVHFLFNLVIHDLLNEDLTLYRGASGVARVLLFGQRIHEKTQKRYFTIKIDVGKGHETQTGAYMMDSHECQLIYNIGYYDFIRALTILQQNLLRIDAL